MGSELLHPVSSFFHEWPRISSMVRLGSRILFHRASLCSFICRLRILSRWSRRFCSISSLLCLSRSKKPCHHRRVVKAIQSFTGSPDLLNFVWTCLSVVTGACSPRHPYVQVPTVASVAGASFRWHQVRSFRSWVSLQAPGGTFQSHVATVPKDLVRRSKIPKHISSDFSSASIYKIRARGPCNSAAFATCSST